jgi:hypothetical protein
VKGARMQTGKKALHRTAGDQVHIPQRTQKRRVKIFPALCHGQTTILRRLLPADLSALDENVKKRYGRQPQDRQPGNKYFP